jgi:c-di-GMP-binding flagellar brake protein YcgR
MHVAGPSSKKESAPPEFRQHERSRFASTAHLLLPNHRIVEARTIDISAGGIRLLVPANLPLHLMCNVKLTVPAIPCGSHTVMARAQVSNIVFSGKESGFLVGLRYISISKAALQAVEHYLHEKFTHTRRTGRTRRPSASSGRDVS